MSIYRKTIESTEWAYLYCLPEHPMKKDASAFRYLSVNKVARYTDFKAGQVVLLLYRKHKNNVPGIIGYCKVAGNITKVSSIPAEERKYCYNRSLLQLPVNEIRCKATQNIIDEDLLYTLPSMNEYAGRLRVFSKCNLINLYGAATNEINELSNYWYVWRSERSKIELEQYKILFLHLKREEMEYKKYLELIHGVIACRSCGYKSNEFQPYTPRFFEFHETKKICIGKYLKIDYKEFIPLCPNCHKKAHEEIVEQSFKDKEYGYVGFSPNYLASGWNPKYFEEEFDL